MDENSESVKKSKEKRVRQAGLALAEVGREYKCEQILTHEDSLEITS